MPTGASAGHPIKQFFLGPSRREIPAAGGKVFKRRTQPGRATGLSLATKTLILASGTLLCAALLAGLFLRSETERRLAVQSDTAFAEALTSLGSEGFLTAFARWEETGDPTALADADNHLTTATRDLSALSLEIGSGQDLRLFSELAILTDTGRAALASARNLAPEALRSGIAGPYERLYATIAEAVADARASNIAILETAAARTQRLVVLMLAILIASAFVWTVFVHKAAIAPLTDLSRSVRGRKPLRSAAFSPYGREVAAVAGGLSARLAQRHPPSAAVTRGEPVTAGDRKEVKEAVAQMTRLACDMVESVVTIGKMEQRLEDRSQKSSERLEAVVSATEKAVRALSARHGELRQQVTILSGTVSEMGQTAGTFDRRMADFDAQRRELARLTSSLETLSDYMSTEAATLLEANAASAEGGAANGHTHMPISLPAPGEAAVILDRLGDAVDATALALTTQPGPTIQAIFKAMDMLHESTSSLALFADRLIAEQEALQRAQERSVEVPIGSTA